MISNFSGAGRPGPDTSMATLENTTEVRKRSCRSDRPSGPRTAVILTYVTCVLVWGTTWFAIRACMGPDGFPPFTAGTLRFLVATGILALLWLAGFGRSGFFSARSLAWTTVAAIIGAVSAALVYFAEQWVSGALAAIVNSTLPLMMAVVATLSGAEKVSRGSVVGCLIALAGIIVIFSDRLCVSAAQALGVGLLLFSVAISAINNVIVKRHTSRQHPIALSLMFNFVAIVVFACGSMVCDRHVGSWPPPVVPVSAAIYLGIFGSAIAFSSYLYLIKHVSLMTVTTLVFFPPLIALCLDAWLERQVVLSQASYAGIAITLVGVAVAMLLPRPGQAGALMQTVPEDQSSEQSL